MPIVHTIAAIQTSTNGYQGLSEYSALYITIGIAAVVFGLIVFIFIRTSTKASRKHDTPEIDETDSSRARQH